MQTLTIEWRHLEVEGETCDRCDSTGHEVRAIVSELNRECFAAGVIVTLQETLLAEQDIAQSNQILINGKPVENLLAGVSASSSSCSSCSELTGKEQSCRTLITRGAHHETVPRSLIRAAFCAVAGCC